MLAYRKQYLSLTTLSYGRGRIGKNLNKWTKRCIIKHPPRLDVIEWTPVVDIEENKAALCMPVVGGCDAAVSLLPWEKEAMNTLTKVHAMFPYLWVFWQCGASQVHATFPYYWVFWLSGTTRSHTVQCFGYVAWHISIPCSVLWCQPHVIDNQDLVGDALSIMVSTLTAQAHSWLDLYWLGQFLKVA